MQLYFTKSFARVKSIFWIITWGILYSITMSIAKTFDDNILTTQVVGLRNIIGTILLSFFLLYKSHNNNKEKLLTHNKSHIGFHILRSLLGCIAMFSTYYAYRNINLSTATTIGFTTPFFSTIFSVALLRETISKKKIFAIIIGYIGVAAMAQPKWNALGFNAAFLAAISANIASSLSMVIVKKLSLKENPLSILFWYQIGTFSLFTLYICITEDFYVISDISNTNLVKILSISILAVLSQFCYISSLKYAELSFVAPFEYLRIIYATVIGFYFFGELVDIYDLLGVMMIASGTFILMDKNPLEGGVNAK